MNWYLYYFDYLLFFICFNIVGIGVYFSLNFLKKIKILNLKNIIYYLSFQIVIVITLHIITNTQQHKSQDYLASLIDTYGYLFEKNGLEKINLNTPDNDQTYLQLVQLQKDVLEKNPKLSDIYTFGFKEGKYVLVVDSETDYNRNGQFTGDRESRTAIGTEYEKLTQELNLAFSGEKVFTKIPYSDEWGTWVSYLSPVRNKFGIIYAVFGLDFSADEYIKSINTSRRLTLLVFGLIQLIVLIFISLNYLIAKEKEDIKQLHVKMRETFRNLPAGTIIINTDNSVELNEEALNILQLNKDDVKDFNQLTDVMFASEKSNLIKEISNVKQGGLQIKILTKYRMKKIVNFYTYTNNDQTVWLIQDITSDIENNYKFRMIFEQSNDGFMLVNEEGFITDCNQSTLTLFGLNDKNDILFKKLAELSPIHQENNIASYILYDQYVAKARAENGATFNWSIQTATNQMRFTKLSMNSIDMGSQTMLLFVISDLTQQKQAEEDIKSANIRAQFSARMASLGEMASGIAHEINNPLAIIRASADMLAKKIRKNLYNQEYALTQLDRVVFTSDRIAKIIKGLRSLSEEGTDGVFTFTNTEMLLNNTMEFCKQRIEHFNIDLKVENYIPEVEFEAKAVQLSQALLILINNSVDAISDQPQAWIKIKAQQIGERIMISVCDSGNGIPNEIADKIMTPFFTTKDPDKGTGLGLSIAHNILSEHHGEVYLEKTSKNTEFVIMLPLKQPANQIRKVLKAS